MFTMYNITPPPVTPTHTTTTKGSQYHINTAMADAMTELALRANLDLPELVELQRNQTNHDYRLNKALHPLELHKLYAGYVHQDHITIMAIVGFLAAWSQTEPTQKEPIRSHKSASEHLNAFTRALREGQDAGQYLVLNESILQRYPGIQCSPFAMVPKKDLDIAFEGRAIHDMTCAGPNNESSTNSMTLQDSLPHIDSPKIAQVAQRITLMTTHAPPGIRLMVKCGDVHQAF